MDNCPAKFKINLSQGEIEVEGSEEFVQKHIEKLEKYTQLLNVISQTPLTKEPTPKKIDSDKKDKIQQQIADTQTKIDIPETFGEWLHKLPSDATDAMKVLFAGYYCQKHSDNNCFHISSVNALLKDHGLKVSNSSTTIKRLVTAKKVFQVGKAEGFVTYRVTKDTDDEILETIRE